MHNIKIGTGDWDALGLMPAYISQQINKIIKTKNRPTQCKLNVSRLLQKTKTNLDKHLQNEITKMPDSTNFSAYFTINIL